MNKKISIKFNQIFILLNSDYCFCGNSYGKYNCGYSSCNISCSGNSLEICGGFMANSIYEVGK